MTDIAKWYFIVLNSLHFYLSLKILPESGNVNNQKIRKSKSWWFWKIYFLLFVDILEEACWERFPIHRCCSNWFPFGLSSWQRCRTTIGTSSTWWRSAQPWTASGTMPKYPKSSTQVRAPLLSYLPWRNRRTRWCRPRYQCRPTAAGSTDLGSDHLSATSTGRLSGPASRTVRLEWPMFLWKFVYPVIGYQPGWYKTSPLIKKF